MSLKQSIVVKNEFTHNNVATPGKGSRGGTPGQFVLRYMARLDATETLTPVALNRDGSVFDYTTRYMMRDEATEMLKEQDSAFPSISELKDTFIEQDGLTGRAFGRRGISLSDEAVRESSATIQDAFDEGHAVQKIILSFTEAYLREQGIIDEAFNHKGRGSYKGRFDQLKLRQAVIKGVDKMTAAGNYKNPEWVGVIQVDSNYLHTHLALVDTEFSPSRMVDDSHDKGKLTQREMMQLRRGVHYGLNEMKSLKSFHEHASLERQNVVGFVKDYAYNYAGKSSQLQVILAALPEQQNLWRHGTNRKEMKRANELTEEFVQNLFDTQPARSGYSDAHKAIVDYVQDRTKTEGLDKQQQDRLVKNGESLLIERSVNGVYKSFKGRGFDKTTLPVNTPMIDIQSSSQEELLASVADGFDQAGFELRVRGYSTRRNHHEKKTGTYKKLLDVFDESNQNNQVAPEAFALRRFYQEELDFNMSLTDKYRSFFVLNTRQDRLNVAKHLPKFDELSERYLTIKQVDAFMEAVDDGSALSELSEIKTQDDVFTQSDKVNTYIQDVYGVKQGVRAFSSLYRSGIEDDIKETKKSYTTDLREYTFGCFKDGVATQKDWRRLQIDQRKTPDVVYREQVNDSGTLFVPPAKPQVRGEGITPKHFDDVKALDIHHLGIDYYGKSDRTIKTAFREKFADAMKWREYFVQQARDFLNKTQQRFRAGALDEVDKDVTEMRDCVDQMSQDGLIPTIDPIHADGTKRNSQTIRIDTGVDVMPTVHQELESFKPADIERVLIEPDDALEL